MKSDVETKLFHVSLVISEVSFKMSDESHQTKSNCLSAVGTILSQIENLVKSKLSSINDDVCDQISSVGDVSDYDSSSRINVCISSCDELLWWDNYNYYKLFYDDTDADDGASTSSDGNSSSEEEHEALDGPNYREQCAIRQEEGNEEEKEEDEENYLPGVVLNLGKCCHHLLPCCQLRAAAVHHPYLSYC